MRTSTRTWACNGPGGFNAIGAAHSQPLVLAAAGKRAHAPLARADEREAEIGERRRDGRARLRLAKATLDASAAAFKFLEQFASDDRAACGER